MAIGVFHGNEILLLKHVIVKVSTIIVPLDAKQFGEAVVFTLVD